MKPAQFEYLNPSSIDEAVSLLNQYADDDAKVLAGGQSLVPLMNFRLARPKWLIDINGIEALDYIREEGDWLAVGAITRERAMEKSQLVADKCPLLKEVTRWIGHTTIRNRGTVGGCIAHNDPTAEYPLAATLLGAEVKAQGPNGVRSIPIQDFLVTYLTTALEPNEILTEVRFPVMAQNVGWAFQEFARRHGDFAIVEVGAMLTMDNGTVKDARIAIGGAGPVAFRATDAEEVLKGQQITDELLEEASEKAGGMTEPDSDVHASAEYRTHLAKVLTRRALKEAHSRAH
ncbi:MAG TPA: xanthine dehydrogenase family protein subunit M [Chloroflexota bacterium]|nr:xanthine dehydrogenase family protein subunit M [Chloroflexota bacterium]